VPSTPHPTPGWPPESNVVDNPFDAPRGFVRHQPAPCSDSDAAQSERKAPADVLPVPAQAKAPKDVIAEKSEPKAGSKSVRTGSISDLTRRQVFDQALNVINDYVGSLAKLKYDRAVETRNDVMDRLDATLAQWTPIDEDNDLKAEASRLARRSR